MTDENKSETEVEAQDLQEKYEALLEEKDQEIEKLQNDLEKDLIFGQTQNIPCLILALGDAFNTAAENFRKIAGIVDDKGDQYRQKSSLPQKLGAARSDGHLQIDAIENIGARIAIGQQAG
jgi:hypothetical protein